MARVRRLPSSTRPEAVAKIEVKVGILGCFERRRLHGLQRGLMVYPKNRSSFRTVPTLAAADR
jgi:hypothetical protein